MTKEVEDKVKMIMADHSTSTGDLTLKGAIAVAEFISSLQHKLTVVECAYNARIKLYDEDLSGREVNEYLTNEYIECATEMNQFAEISLESIMNTSKPELKL